MATDGDGLFIYGGICSMLGAAAEEFTNSKVSGYMLAIVRLQIATVGDGLFVCAKAELSGSINCIMRPLCAASVANS